MPATRAHPRHTLSARDFAALLTSHGAKVRALATRLTGSEDLADEIVQETFLAAWRYRKGFRGSSLPSTWLYTIAVRTAKRLRQRRSIARARTGSLDAMMPLQSGAIADPRLLSSDPARTRIEREAVEAMEEAIARLPEPFRVALVLKEIAELPLEDVGRVLGIKPQTAKTRVHRARLMVRSAIENALPRQNLPAAAYPRQVCMDLLAAKQSALDRGQPFPVEHLICDRCKAVFAALDLGNDLCHRLGRGILPGKVRRQILDATAMAAIA